MAPKEQAAPPVIRFRGFMIMTSRHLTQTATLVLHRRRWWWPFRTMARLVRVQVADPGCLFDYNLRAFIVHPDRYEQIVRVLEENHGTYQDFTLQEIRR